MSALPTTLPAVFVQRRNRLAEAFAGLALIPAGLAAPRNYPANTYPYRASSHFLYLVGAAPEGAMLLLADGKYTLFADPPDQDDALWHGPRPELLDLAESLQIEQCRPRGELAAALRGKRGAVLDPPDAASVAQARQVMEIDPDAQLALSTAMIGVRLLHDEAAQAQLRAAAAASAVAHQEGMRATKPGRYEREVAAAMAGHFQRLGMENAYSPIVTVRGEVLHNHRHDGLMREGDLLLCDVGGETKEGWASDITRTWPVSGKFSKTQRAIYEVVLEAQLAAIAKVRPHVSYRQVHETAKREMVRGLVGLGIFRGELDGLLERGAAALFFPHGVGHLLGLDVHDMEDLGDAAGYAPGRARSFRFGDRYLRLDRDLTPGMAVTVEPGFYQVPGILQDETLTGPLGTDLCLAELARYADVRGIRIEDDVLCTVDEPEVLSAECPKRCDKIERVMRG